MPERLKIGTVARCCQGKTGLILSITSCRDPMTGKYDTLYKGACLDKGLVGYAWQSINPEPIGTLDEWVKLRAEEIV